jgi:hypothetical protein
MRWPRRPGSSPRQHTQHRQGAPLGAKRRFAEATRAAQVASGEAERRHALAATTCSSPRQQTRTTKARLSARSADSPKATRAAQVASRGASRT